VQILRRGREQVTDCEIDVTSERAETDPKVFTSIHLKYRVTGRDLAPAKVERAIELSKEKYCSASIMLGATAKITHEWTVVQESEALEEASR
jgi:putative redox protein